MNRRGIIGVLMGAPAAAKAAGLADLSAGPIGADQRLRNAYSSAGENLGLSAISYSPLDAVDMARERLASFQQEEDDIRRTEMRSVGRLDADLASNRSMSLSVKMLVQGRRNAEHRVAERRGWLQEQLDSLLRAAGLSA